MGAGAGIINARAAVELVETNRSPETTIGGEDVVASGIYTVSTSARRVAAVNRGVPTAGRAVHEGPTRHDIGRRIIWGPTRRRDHLGHAAGDSIVWGTNTGDSIVWGTTPGDSIVWGTGAGDSIVWGTGSGRLDCLGYRRGRLDCLGRLARGDSIVWGTADSF